MVEIMLIAIGVIYIIYQLLKAAVEDAEMRNIAKKNGWKTYSSRTGVRYTDTDGKYYGSKRYYKDREFEK